ncbi:hypothetical protein BJ944DRAFT_86205 [Cunninghamella echinulata]|nr:hypothetical protein BJ944DRAFT_86205 [Cunninghamella echinulata]
MHFKKLIISSLLFTSYTFAQDDSEITTPTSTAAPTSTSIQPTTQPTSNVNPHYAALLNNSMWFYEAQRSGKLPSNNRVSW